MNKKNGKIMNKETKKVIKDVKAGKNLSKPFNSVKELIKDLNS